MKKTATLIVLLLVWLPWAGATILERLDLDDLTAESSAVVHGKIVASRVEWNRNRTLIFTVYTVQPLEYLKGRLGPIFELYEPGGALDGLAMSVAGVPSFPVGQEAVLFVWTDPQGQHQVTGYEQGTLPVQTDPQTGLKIVDRAIRLGSARTAPPPHGVVPATSRFLPQLFNQIRSSAAKSPVPAATQ